MLRTELEPLVERLLAFGADSYRQGFDDGAESAIEEGETPHKDTKNEGVFNWTENLPPNYAAIYAKIESLLLRIEGLTDALDKRTAKLIAGEIGRAEVTIRFKRLADAHRFDQALSALAQSQESNNG